MSSNEEALLTRLQANPDDAEAWAVLQDVLLTADDVRGTLMTGSATERSAALEGAAEAWFGEPAVEVDPDTLKIHSADSWEPRIEVTFARGHASHLKADTSWDGGRAGWGQEWMYPALKRFMAQPVARLLSSLELRATPYSEFFYEGLVECFVGHGPLGLRTLYAGDDDQLSWTNVPDVSSIWAVAPWLENVTLEGSNITLGSVVAPRLRSLKLISGGLPSSALRSVIDADLPALEHLEIWFGDSEYGAECSLDDVLPLLDKSLPALKSIGLVNCEFGDELVPAVMKAAWLGQLETLALHDSILTDAGAEALLANADALAHIALIDVHECFLAETPERLTAAFGDRIATDSQNDPYEYGDDEPFYYVGIGE